VLKGQSAHDCPLKTQPLPSERHELLRKAGISLTRKSSDRVRIAAALRALAVHRRAEATSEADAFERWAEALEKGEGNKHER